MGPIGTVGLAAVGQGSPPCVKTLLGGRGGETSGPLTSLDGVFPLLYSSCVAANSGAFPHRLFSPCSSPGRGLGERHFLLPIFDFPV